MKEDCQVVRLTSAALAKRRSIGRPHVSRKLCDKNNSKKRDYETAWM